MKMCEVIRKEGDRKRVSIRGQRLPGRKMYIYKRFFCFVFYPKNIPGIALGNTLENEPKNKIDRFCLWQLFSVDVRPGNFSQKVEGYWRLPRRSQWFYANLCALERSQFSVTVNQFPTVLIKDRSKVLCQPFHHFYIQTALCIVSPIQEGEAAAQESSAVTGHCCLPQAQQCMGRTLALHEDREPNTNPESGFSGQR